MSEEYQDTEATCSSVILAALADAEERDPHPEYRGSVPRLRQLRTRPDFDFRMFRESRLKNR